MPASESPYVVLLATGGTISSRAPSASGGAAVATDDGTTLLSSVSSAPRHPVTVIDVLNVGSYLLSVTDMLTICASIQDALADPLVLGVVVTHGTDTMEETAYLADLVHDDERPVVFTGAQKSADSADPDGPDNLLRAIAVASAPEATGRGVLLSFAGEIFPAKGVCKSATLDLRAFSNPGTGPVGFVTGDGDVRFGDSPARASALPLPTSVGAIPPRVDVVALYPGADTAQLAACLAAGATGIVLQGTGSGNANQEICDAVADAAARGVVVVTSTRVLSGPVVPIYGTGGGKTLVAAGAIPSGTLRPSQSLVLLSLLLRLRLPREAIADEFASRGAGSEHPLDTPSVRFLHSDSSTLRG